MFFDLLDGVLTTGRNLPTLEVKAKGRVEKGVEWCCYNLVEANQENKSDFHSFKSG